MKKIMFYLKYVQFFLLEAPYSKKKEKKSWLKKWSSNVFFHKNIVKYIESTWFLLSEITFGLMRPSVYKQQSWC